MAGAINYGVENLHITSHVSNILLSCLALNLIIQYNFNYQINQEPLTPAQERALWKMAGKVIETSNVENA